MTTTNSERLKRYKAKMTRGGMKRLTIWVHPDLDEFIKRNCEPCECKGRCLERLLLGQARPRPLPRGDSWSGGLEISDTHVSAPKG